MKLVDCTIQEVMSIIEGGDVRIMFHGTAGDFGCFSEGKVGVGGDCNSALGVHFAEWPDSAAEYAESGVEREEGNSARIVVALVPAKSPYFSFSYFDFFGYDDDGGQLVDHDGFRVIRRNLISLGHDICDYEDGEQVISVSLVPERIKVIGFLSVDEAIHAGEIIRQLGEAQFCPVERVNVLCSM